MKTLTRRIFAALALLSLTATCLAQLHSREIDLNFAPARTNINFTLVDILHTVHGSFNLKRGTVHFDPATNTIRGEILVDAVSGHSGSDGRDKRMQNDVLESSHYPDIAFQPDHVEGQVADIGVSTLQVHGIFSIHGTGHEITIPVQVEMAPGQWTATSHFAVPYVAWGMKNPSTFVLRVSQSVDIEIRATGEMP
jgi:polyisoprenoid-binding protein YceI